MVNTVFTHTNERQYLGAQVSEYFLRHNSATPRDVEVRLLHSHDFEFLSAGEEYSTISAGITSPVRGQEITLTMSGGLLQALLVLVPGFVAAEIYHSLTSHPKPSQFERVVQALMLTVFVWMIAMPLASVSALALIRPVASDTCPVV